ncbi:MAG: RecQ family ATP-dependent DNA helicase [Clostridia bacterium]|jgi:ATP-dependent DNA helicase RecQ|nr:RecQ family ATP-dependent DNA helicase [Clostridia bacterium]
MENELSILKRYFGYETFRPGQKNIIENILSHKDVLGIMPTGAGKSICFQVPAMLLKGITIVVSPLISLMKDQVGALVQEGYPAAYLNSSLTFSQQREMLRRANLGRYRIIYIAPERLMTEDFLSFAENAEISMVTVDEAHCISQWGQDFRPSYMKIADFIKTLPKRPVVSAFTATATADVKNDIIKMLDLKNPYTLVTGFDRPNLYFEVQRPIDKDKALLHTLKQFGNKTGIIYCSTRKAVESVTMLLNRHGYSAVRYHAGLDDIERQKNQDDFIYDRKNIIVATNAFGMGIDKSNVSFVIHYNMPKNIENYYQEAGRAGRDGSEAKCILLYSPRDIHTNRFFIENSRDPQIPHDIQLKIIEKDIEKLRQMIFYCTTKHCLRGFILKYFGENPTQKCENCSNCVNKKISTVQEPKTFLSHKSREGTAYFENQSKLMLELKKLRFSISKKEHVPPFIIFTDAVLNEMCMHLPQNLVEFRKIKGVGETKSEKYGTEFTYCIREYLDRYRNEVYK